MKILSYWKKGVRSRRLAYEDGIHQARMNNRKNKALEMLSKLDKGQFERLSEQKELDEMFIKEKNLLSVGKNSNSGPNLMEVEDIAFKYEEKLKDLGLTPVTRARMLENVFFYIINGKAKYKLNRDRK